MQNFFALLLGLGLTGVALASNEESSNSTQFAHDKQVWALSIDNDLFAPGGAGDSDFTAGMALTYTGTQGVRHWRVLDESLAGLDGLFGLTSQEAYVTPTFEIGSYGFTPEDIENSDVLLDDRPYASLVYVAASRLYQSDAPDGDTWSSTFSLGVLGWDIFADGQNSVHSLFAGKETRGWDHQISDGGEPTLRYQLAYHDYWQGSQGHAKTTYFASLGYLTEVGVALSTRNGLISSPDSRFNPELISYGERVNDSTSTPYYGQEKYLWAGIALKARLYNAFLQGQFNNSEHTLSYDELEPLIVEAWLGFTASVSAQTKFSYVLRAQSSEIREGEGDRAHMWGGFVFSHTFNS